ncbi:MAG: hypothetical protein ACF787_01870 [Rhodopirellula sp. JB053]
MVAATYNPTPASLSERTVVSMNARVLDTNVLVLNRFYMPIRVVNVRRALTLL